jgi:ubiquinone biosynthesis protein UbiJ
MLKKYSLKALQKAMNQALHLDKEMPVKLLALDGRVIQMIIKPLQVTFFIQFKASEVHLLDSYDGFPDTVIQSSPMGLIRLSLLPSSKARSLFNDNISITGDIELGQQIKALFDSINIDWEGYLATFTGDVIAYQVGSFVRKGLTFGKDLSESLRQNTTEFLQEEAGIFPTRMEVEDFFTSIDTLALDVQRMQVLLQQLVSSRAEN